MAIISSLRLARLLNDINEDEITGLIKKYGRPEKFSFKTNFLDFECKMIRHSNQKGRFHDVTCFIQHSNGGYVVIQKQQYARSGIYRAPSGGSHKGESLEDAAIREMHEETGLYVKLTRFVLDISLEIICGSEFIPWRSLVFLAEPIDGELRPIDTYEIFDVKILSREELLGDVDKLMNESGWGGFAYRSFLTRVFFKTIDGLDI